jgi:hypothetical protein
MWAADGWIGRTNDGAQHLLGIIAARALADVRRGSANFCDF